MADFTQGNDHQNQNNDIADKSCVICMEVVKSRGRIGCAHLFCFDCIVKWSKVTNRCPVCKLKFKKVSSESMEPEEPETTPKPTRLKGKNVKKKTPKKKVVNVKDKEQGEDNYHRNSYHDIHHHHHALNIMSVLSTFFPPSFTADSDDDDDDYSPWMDDDFDVPWMRYDSESDDEIPFPNGFFIAHHLFNDVIRPNRHHSTSIVRSQVIVENGREVIEILSDDEDSRPAANSRSQRGQQQRIRNSTRSEPELITIDDDSSVSNTLASNPATISTSPPQGQIETSNRRMKRQRGERESAITIDSSDDRQSNTNTGRKRSNNRKV